MRLEPDGELVWITGTRCQAGALSDSHTSCKQLYELFWSVVMCVVRLTVVLYGPMALTGRLYPRELVRYTSSTGYLH